MAISSVRPCWCPACLFSRGGGMHKKIAEHQLPQAPVFIIGHWRSGTTFLHYLLAKDRRFACLSNAQAFMPHTLAGGPGIGSSTGTMASLAQTSPWMKFLLDWESPQEEEFALSNWGMGAYLGLVFSAKAGHLFLPLSFPGRRRWHRNGSV